MSRRRHINTSPLVRVRTSLALRSNGRRRFTSGRAKCRRSPFAVCRCTSDRRSLKPRRSWLRSKKFPIIDAGMNDLIRPALYGSYHEIVPAERLGGTGSVASKVRKDDKEVVPPPPGEKMDIVGPVCESGDFFAQEREVPELRAGDRLAVMSAGAYGFVMASNYNSRPLPAEALVRGDKFALIRNRQTPKDLVRDEIESTW